MFLVTTLLAITTFNEKVEAKSTFYGFKNTLYDILVALGHGSDEPGEWEDWGEKWNRIRSAGEWVPDGDVSSDDVLSGKTFYNESREVQIGTLETTLSCPEGMIPVPESPQDGLSAFCVDKYEAKNVDGIASSQTEESPWVDITWYDASDKCKEVGKHLITETEWLSIAHNLEQVGWNWNGGVVGVNHMSDGHSDKSPDLALSASTDDVPCYKTGQSCDVDTWDKQRRTYKLSNGEYIWDFGANVWEWVDRFNENNYPYVTDWRVWESCDPAGDYRCGNTETTNDSRLGDISTELRALIRGGYWRYNTTSGAFTLAIYRIPSNTFFHIGFRCAR